VDGHGFAPDCLAVGRLSQYTDLNERPLWPALAKFLETDPWLLFLPVPSSNPWRLKVPPRTAAQVIWAGGHGVVSLLITKPYFDWVERDALVKAMLDTVFDGLIRA